MTPRYHFSDAEWPLVQFQLVGDASDPAYFEDSDALIRRGVPYVSVIDATYMKLAAPSALRQQIAWIRENMGELKRLNRALALVLPNPMVRGLLNAVLHFQEIPVPYEVFQDLPTAKAWALREARQAGLSGWPSGRANPGE